MMFVADSGPIISFARADRLALVRQVVRELLIPDAVYHEVVTMGAAMPGAEEVSREDWIKRRSVTSPQAAFHLPGTLGDGEQEAIALAHELGAVLIVDDADARDAALRLQIPVLGSLGLLREAKLQGIIPTVKPHLDALRHQQFRLSNLLYQSFLQEMNEA
jgi:predicted nucleic acid-binding protein